MADEYTPTTEDVRDDWCRVAGQVFDPDAQVRHEKRVAAFDRWIAAHDRAVKAEALREAAEDWGDTTWQEVWMTDRVEDDVSAVQSTVKWLRIRADEMEKEGDR